MPRTTSPCTECGKHTSAIFPLLDIPLCRRCQTVHPDKYALITKTRAVQEYRLKEIDLITIEHIEMKNPHWKTGPRPMQLFLHMQVQELATRKWGGAEPYTVQHVWFPQRLLTSFADRPELLKHLSPGGFQNLVAERLE